MSTRAWRRSMSLAGLFLGRVFGIDKPMSRLLASSRGRVIDAGAGLRRAAIRALLAGPGTTVTRIHL